MAFTQQDRAKYRQEQQELMSKRLEEFSTTWENNPADIVEYLQMQSRFYTYSPRNTALIYSQRPHAAFVGSFHHFQSLGYHVKKGEVGMRIRVPIVTVYYRLRPDRPWKRLTDATEETKRLIAVGAIESKEEISFGIGTVFAIEQTDCPLKDYPKLLGLGYNDDQHAEIYNAVKQYFAAIGIPMHEADLGGAFLRGQYFPVDGSIKINQILGDTQKLSTALHEGAHALLHHNTDVGVAQREFEADALSILFTAHFGLEITPARRDHFANVYRTYRMEWEDGEMLVDKIQSVAALFNKHIKPLSQYVEKVLSPVQSQEQQESVQVAPHPGKLPEQADVPLEDASMRVADAVHSPAAVAAPTGTRRSPGGSTKKGFSAEVKQKLRDIPILEVCNALGIEAKRTGSAGNYVCSVRPDDRDASCHIYPNNSFCDFGNANLGGDTISFVEYVTGKDFYGACEWLASEFGIDLAQDREQMRPRNPSAYDLTDRQFAMIGIQADLATKNFDLDVARYGEKNTAEFVAKYRMPVQTLARQHPDIYRNMLLARAIPYVYDLRQEYYLALRTNDRLAQSVGHDILSDPNMLADLENMRKELVAAESILKQAIPPALHIRYTPKTYDVVKDIQDIRAGKISIEVGNIRYSSLKAETKSMPAERMCREISADVYFSAPQFHEDTPHAAFLKGDTVNVAYRRKYHEKLFPDVPIQTAAKTPVVNEQKKESAKNVPIQPPGKKR